MFGATTDYSDVYKQIIDKNWNVITYISHTYKKYSLLVVH